MYAIIAFIPIIVTVVLMVGFNWPAKRALPLAWALAFVIGVAVWKMSIAAAVTQTVIGFLEAFAVLVIIFGAILIMNTLSASGAMAAINRMFTGISSAARIQAWAQCGRFSFRADFFLSCKHGRGRFCYHYSRYYHSCYDVW